MVTWQSANQLKTPGKVSWAFKMISQFGSLGYTIMGKMLIWQLSRRQSLTSFTRRVSHKHSLPKKLAVHRVLYPSMLTESWVEGKSVEEKDAQPTERTAALWGLSSKIDSRIWVNFTRNGTEAGVKASRAIFGSRSALKSHQRCSAGIRDLAFCRPVKFFHTDWTIISLWSLPYTQRHCHVRIEKGSVQTVAIKLEDHNSLDYDYLLKY